MYNLNEDISRNFHTFKDDKQQILQGLQHSSALEVIVRKEQIGFATARNSDNKNRVRLRSFVNILLTKFKNVHMLQMKVTEHPTKLIGI